MATTQSIRFNTAPLNRENLIQLATTEPNSARKYLEEVQQSLRTLGVSAGADQLEEVIRAPNLVEQLTGSTTVAGLFPSNAGAIPNLGWNTNGGTPWKAAYVQGSLRRDPNTNLAELVTPGGRRYAIRSGYDPNTGRTSGLQLDRMMFIDEPQVVVKGTLAIDGQSLKLEAASPLRPGFETFEAGRVLVNGDEVRLDSMREDIVITNPRLKNQLRFLPSLGVIVPGEARRNENGQLIYDGAPEEFFALVGFIERPGEAPGSTPHPWDRDPNDPGSQVVPEGRRYAVGNMAQSNRTFRAKPVVLPDDPTEQAKVNSFALAWVSGRFVENRDSTGAIDSSNPYRYFDATHVTVPVSGAFSSFDTVASMLPNEPDAPVRLSATQLNEANTDRSAPAVLWSAN